MCGLGDLFLPKPPKLPDPPPPPAVEPEPAEFVSGGEQGSKPRRGRNSLKRPDQPTVGTGLNIPQ